MRATKNFRTQAWMLAGAVLLAGIAITALMTWRVWNGMSSKMETNFDFRVSAIQSHIGERMEHQSQVLYTLRGFYQASRIVNRQEWHDFTDALRIQQNYPGIHDVGAVMFVPATRLNQHVAWMRTQDVRDYLVWPPGSRQQYAPIVFRKITQDPQLRVLGFDLYSNPERHEAIERARDSDMVVVTRKTRIIQHPEEDQNAGLVAYLPLYRNGQAHNTLVARRSNNVGWVYASFPVGTLMEGGASGDAANLHVRIYDGEELSERNLLFDSERSQQDSTARLQALRRIDFGGRSLMLAVYSTPAFEVAFMGKWPLATAVVGVALSAVLAAIIWMLFTGRQRALKLAAQLTGKLRESESRFREIANDAPVFIWTWDVEKQQCWINRYGLDFLGFEQLDDYCQQADGHIHTDDVTARRNIYQKAFMNGESFSMEYRARHHGGQYRWLLIRGIPRFDQNGQVIGFIGSGTDITERKETEENLKKATLVYQNSREAMVVFDANAIHNTTSVVDINPAFTAITGYTASEMLGKSIWGICDYQQDPAYYDAMRHAYLTTGTWEGEYLIRRKDGGTSIFWLKMHAIFESPENNIRYIGLWHDITKQKESEATIRSLTTSLITAKEDEARRIAREIHDDLGQRLSLLRMDLIMLPRKLRQQAMPSNRANLDGLVQRMCKSIDESLHVVRDIASNLRPATLDMGFVMAIQWQLQHFHAHTGIACALDNGLPENFALPDEQSTGAFRIFQEALTNIARHAGASQVDVFLQHHDEKLILEISDNGQGFDVGKRGPRSNGLTGMRERATMLGGCVDIVSRIGEGTTVFLSTPVQYAKEAPKNVQNNDRGRSCDDARRVEKSC